MPMVSALVAGSAGLAFLVFGLTLAWAEKQSRLAAAARARSAEKADNDNSFSRAA